MRFFTFVTAFLSLSAIASSANADNHDETEAAKPKLVIAIAVDQLSSDLFAEYRNTFTGGLKRLSDGAVFPSGYQSHAATETCPGHATIMTGVHPGRAGIIANNWIDLDSEREDKTIYCAEDERVDGTNFGDITKPEQANYVASAWHLLVPTLGERLKKISPSSRNMAVSGKDRAGLMMAGNNTDMIFWLGRRGFETKKGGLMLDALPAFNAELGKSLASPRAPIEAPAHCAARNHAIPTGEGKAVGTYQFQRPANAGRAFFLSPDQDAAVLQLAAILVENERLGTFDFTDVLSIGLSSTDYVGHAFGTEGVEMCIQMSELDRYLGDFFDKLDKLERDYVVVLTADHGGLDLPERAKLQAMPDAQRLDPKMNVKEIDKEVRRALGIEKADPILYADSPFGDYYIDRNLKPDVRAQVKRDTMAFIANHPQVETVLDGTELAKMPMPKGSVEEWSLAERARASYHPDRSGDFIVLLKKGVTPIPDLSRGYVATHGSPWEYDRRVPILFWRKGMTGFEQPLSVQTVDIAPTLGAMIGVEFPASETDGRCLDLDSGAGNSCD